MQPKRANFQNQNEYPAHNLIKLERVKAKYNDDGYQENITPTFQPTISQESKKIVENKHLGIIYTKERLLQIKEDKLKSIQKIKQEQAIIQMEKEMSDHQLLQEVQNTMVLSKSKFNDIKPRVFQAKKSPIKPTSTEMEYIEHCTFNPATNQKSVQDNSVKVEDRLLKYTEQKSKKIEEITKMLSPKFQPFINQINEPTPKLSSQKKLLKNGEVSLNTLQVVSKIKEVEKYGNLFSMDDVKVLLDYQN